MREGTGGISGRFKALVDRLDEEAPQNCLGNGATEDEVRAVERALQVRLPESYRRFLREFGFAYWPAFIYGVPHGKLPGMRVTWQTEVERGRVVPPLPPHLVPFSPDGWGNHYCLDTSRGKGPECPVVFWDHELGEDQTPQESHASFLEWLEEALEENDEAAGEEGEGEGEGADEEEEVAGSAPTPRPGRQLPAGPRGVCFPPPYRGAPPLDRDGSPVELHLRNQNPAGPLDEMLRLDHRGATRYARNHPGSRRAAKAQGPVSDSSQTAGPPEDRHSGAAE